MTTYDDKQVAVELRYAVAARGRDFVYEKPQGLTFCVNWHGPLDGGVPGCIVGHVIYKILCKEFDEDTARKHVHKNTQGAAGALIESLRPLGIHFTAEAVNLLSHVQGLQDKGTAWGQAVETALYAADLCLDDTDQEVKDDDE